MSEFKGTKGKWKVDFLHKDKPSIEALNSNGTHYKTVILWGDANENAGIINHGIEQHANAQLIAHAPQMLEAMQEFCKDVENSRLKSRNTYYKFKLLIQQATTI